MALIEFARRGEKGGKGREGDGMRLRVVSGIEVLDVWGKGSTLDLAPSDHSSSQLSYLQAA